MSYPRLLPALLIGVATLSHAAPPAVGQAPIEVYFSPNGGCTDAIVKTIDAAQKSLLVQAYYFTSSPIAKALVEAKKRGLDVRVILDKSQIAGGYSSADFLAQGGVPTFIDSQHAVAHNKVIIVDGTTVITGSFNFTAGAEKNNAENLLILHDNQPLADKYTANWTTHLAHSSPYSGKAN
ncbi:phospholipase D family protein [soil metagenome]